MGLTLISYHVASMNHQTSFTSICNIGFNLLNRGSFVNVLQNLLINTFNTRNNQMATSLLHQTHGLIIQIYTSIAQPTNLLIDTLLNHHIADFRNTLLIDCKGIILEHDFLHIREVIDNVLDFSNNVFRTAQSIAMAMKSLRINTEVTLCRTAATSKNLNRRECCCGEDIVRHTQSALDELRRIRNLIQVGNMQRTYLAIDLKSYYASAECAARHLDPLTTNLVVADASRTEKTICLAVSPSLKSYGIPGRARLFEVVQRVKEVNNGRLRDAIRNRTAVYKDGTPSLAAPSYDATALAADPSLEVSYLVAPPRMAYYEKISRQIYGIYLRYIAPEDIVVYSSDEVFIDATAYLTHYKMSAHDLAMTMIREVLYTTGITATAGIGTNLYLAKLAMDITAKHAAPDKDGVRIAELDEESFRYLLWDHKPLTDFWQTGPGTVRRLEKHGIHTMGELARASVQYQEILYDEFGVDAEILIDHAWGLEPCGMKEINAYRPETNSLSEGQVLSCPYPYDKARIIVQEMTDSLVFQLTDKGLVTDSLTLDIGYDRENCDKGIYHGPVHIDHYGRTIPKGAHGTAKLDNPTNLSSQLMVATMELFDRIVNKKLTVRRITIAANRVVKDQGILQVDLFTDTSKLEREKSLQATMLGIKKKFGKNAVLKGTNYLEGATMRERNGQIGGHKAK